VADELINDFEEFKLRKSRATSNWMIFTIQNSSEVCVHSQGLYEDPEQFCSKLHTEFDTDPCWAAVNIEFETSDGRPSSKIVFVSWVPGGAKIRERMIFAGTTSALRSAIPGLSAKLQAGSPNELTVESLTIAASKFS
jgi:cofilin